MDKNDSNTESTESIERAEREKEAIEMGIQLSSNTHLLKYLEPEEEEDRIDFLDYIHLLNNKHRFRNELLFCFPKHIEKLCNYYLYVYGLYTPKKDEDFIGCDSVNKIDKRNRPYPTSLGLYNYLEVNMPKSLTYYYKRYINSDLGDGFMVLLKALQVIEEYLLNLGLSDKDMVSMISKILDKYHHIVEPEESINTMPNIVINMASFGSFDGEVDRLSNLCSDQVKIESNHLDVPDVHVLPSDTGNTGDTEVTGVIESKSTDLCKSVETDNKSSYYIPDELLDEIENM
jgi:hypothetical protein